MSAPSSFADTLVSLRQADKRYRGRPVLHVEALELRRGDRMMIKGTNGSGKSTLLRLLAGVTTPSTGVVTHSARFDGLAVAFVPQEGGALPHLTVAQNVVLATRLSGRQIPSRLAERWYIHELGLQSEMNTRFGELSGGFKRMAALCCALATEPDGLFVDEPLSGVDTARASAVADGLLAAASHMEFLVLTSHALAEFSAASRVISVENGAPTEC